MAIAHIETSAREGLTDFFVFDAAKTKRKTPNTLNNVSIVIPLRVRLVIFFTRKDDNGGDGSGNRYGRFDDRSRNPRYGPLVKPYTRPSHRTDFKTGSYDFISKRTRSEIVRKRLEELVQITIQ